MYDILIKNGQIVDGTGNPAYYGDIAVKDGIIAKIAPSIEGEAATVIARPPARGNPFPFPFPAAPLCTLHNFSIHFSLFCTIAFICHVEYN